MDSATPLTETSPIKLRKVAISDAKALLPLILQLGYPTTEENLVARIALYQHSFNDKAWIALEGEEIVGAIAVHTYDVFHCTEKFARIVSLVVKHNHRRSGIGSKLVLRAERFANQKKCSAIELSSSLKRAKTGTLDFYHSLGYYNEGEYESTYLRKFLKPKEGPILSLFSPDGE